MNQPARLRTAAASGLLAAGAGVGVSMLLAALLGGVAPVYALGSRVVDLTPGWLKDWAVEHLGERDKDVLLLSVFAVVALLAALVGVIAVRRPRTGLLLAALLNLVALLASVRGQGGLELSWATVLPGVASLLLAVAALGVLTGQWRRHTPAEAPKGLDRRAFLLAATAVGGVAVVGAGGSTLVGARGADSRAAVRLPRPVAPAMPLPAGAALDVRGLTPYLTPNRDFYRVDVALKVPQIDATTWRLRLHGMVDQPLSLSFKDLLEMPLVERRITLTCVSNQVGDQYVGNATWLGVRMSDLLKRVGVRRGADAVVSTARDGMTISTPLAALTDGRDALLAVGMNGEPLPLAHGFPARMVVPGLYGYVSATKWVEELELTTFSRVSTYWTQRGWAEQAPIKTGSRIDVPRQFATVPAGTVQVAGVAYAQRRGIERVEVRVDGGPWQLARLATQDSIDNWRQWVFPWEASAGQHKLEVRATDRTGNTQTSDRVPPRPDGATGWHSVTVTVR